MSKKVEIVLLVMKVCDLLSTHNLEEYDSKAEDIRHGGVSALQCIFGRHVPAAFFGTPIAIKNCSRGGRARKREVGRRCWEYTH